jgi:PAS domain S-box-containing protein
MTELNFTEHVLGILQSAMMKENLMSEDTINTLYKAFVNLEEKLANERYQLEFLMTHLPMAIYFKDLQSRFLNVSRYCAALYRVTPQDLIGKTDFDFQRRDRAQQAFNDEQEIIRTGKPKIDYLELEVMENGTERWVNSTKMPLTDANGMIVGTFGISQDVTEVKNQNKELLVREEKIRTQRNLAAQQNLKLARAWKIIDEQNTAIKRQNETLEAEVEKRTQDLVAYNQQLEQFAFISGHNLRAPAARIFGLGNLLSKLDALSPEREEIIQKIIRETEELDHVVKDLNTILDVRRDQTSILATVDLDEVVEQIRVGLAREITETQTHLITDLSEVKSILSIRPYIHSIFLNLISNSIKYRYPGRPPVILIQAANEDDYIKLIFRDNGLGIDLSTSREKLFSLYHRFHTHVEGKGMGLYLVKTQVMTMGGRIEVFSEVNQGTTFHVYLKRK